MTGALLKENIFSNAADLPAVVRQAIVVSVSEKTITLQVAHAEAGLDLVIDPAMLAEYDHLVIDNCATRARFFIAPGKSAPRPLQLNFTNRPGAQAQMSLAAENSSITLDCRLRAEQSSELDCFMSVQDASAQISVDAEIFRNARARFFGLTRASAENVVSLTMHVHHFEGMSHTEQKFYSYAADKSAVTFTGKISVAPGAGESVAHQLHRGTILSREARISAQPFLNIMHDDVRCTHGSTVGFIDEDAKRYLMAGGMAEADAEKTLVESSQRQFIEVLPAEGRAFFGFAGGDE